MWLLLLFIYLTNRDRTIRGSLSRAGASQNILGPAPGRSPHWSVGSRSGRSLEGGARGLLAPGSLFFFSYCNSADVLTLKMIQGLKRRVPEALALERHHLLFLEHSVCLLRSVLITETLEHAVVRKGDTDASCGPSSPGGDGPCYNLAPGCLPLITEQMGK